MAIISLFPKRTVKYKIYGVSIDLNNTNPETSVTYTDDAVDMTSRSELWDEFFGHYPCILKGGVETLKLNPDNFAQDIDGNPVNLASADVGDVMIAFPRRGIKIFTVGTTIKIQITDAPNNPEFTYYAHQRGTIEKDIFYLGAYKGFLKDSKLRSWSGKLPTTTQTITEFRTQAQTNGTGYDQGSFYQLTFRQALYLLKYKNLDSQTALGRGYVDGNSSAMSTGGTNTKGMDWGETTGKQQMKLFGIEDFWGNIGELIEGLYCNSTRNILTATENFNDTGTGYVDNGKGATVNLNDFMSKPQGTSETGFIAKEVLGSATTYFCDRAILNNSTWPTFGGHWNSASVAGVFYLAVGVAVSTNNSNLGSRLMYL